MFLRVVRAAGGKGVEHEYVRVVEAFRENGKTRHRTVLNLGRKDLLAAHLDLIKLTRLLHGETFADGGVRREDIHAVGAWDWGPMLVVRHMWHGLGLAATLDKLARPGRRDTATLSDRALVLVANRLTAPAANMAWRGGWRPTSSAIATAVAGWPHGATILRARPAGRHG